MEKVKRQLSIGDLPVFSTGYCSKFD